MFKGILNFLDKAPSDELDAKIEREPIVKKYWLHLGGSILCLILFMLVSIMIILQNSKIPERPTFLYTPKELIKTPTLPYPHQSMNNIQAWLTDAIVTAYSFSFANMDEQTAKVEYFFTPDGYKTYLQSLKTSGVEETIKSKRLVTSIVLLQDPVLINSGRFGGIEFWRFRVPCLVSFFGGTKPLVEKQMVETLVVRVPAHENHRGLGISEFNMSPI